MHRDTDGAGLIGDGAGDSLADPPSGVRGELVAPAVIEFVDRLHESDIAFLNEIEELKAAVRVALGDGDHQAEIGLYELLFGDVGFELAAFDDLKRSPKFSGRRAGFLLELLY